MGNGGLSKGHVQSNYFVTLLLATISIDVSRFQAQLLPEVIVIDQPPTAKTAPD